MFAYCVNDPVNNEDPDGEYAIALANLYVPLIIGVGLVVYAAGTYAKNRIKKSYVTRSEGIVYERTDKKNDEKYVRQAKNEKRYKKRKSMLKQILMLNINLES
jgi:hypothetical protein